MTGLPLKLSLNLFRPGVFGYSAHDLIKLAQLSDSVHLLKVEWSDYGETEFAFLKKGALLYALGCVQTTNSITCASHSVVVILRELHELRAKLRHARDEFSDLEYRAKIARYLDRLMDLAREFLEVGYDERFSARLKIGLEKARDLIDSIREDGIIDLELMDEYVARFDSFLSD